ncbi:hypothetical protein HOG21_02400 [bacterium]|nr:hypothetical protein [bacterium]
MQIKDDSQNFTKNKKIKFSVKLKKILEKIKLIIQKRKTTFTHKPIINKQTIKKEETKNKNKKFWSFKKIYTKRTVFYS